MYSFKCIRAGQILNGCSAYREKLISFKALRVYLAIFEEAAKNEAQNRSIRVKSGLTKAIAPIRKEALSKVFKGSVARELRQLRSAGLISKNADEIITTEMLLSFSKKDSRSSARKIPVPREMLGRLIKETRPAVVLTALTYFVRGLSFTHRTGELRRAGSIKAAHIREFTGLSIRAVRAARAKLISQGWIERDEGSTQLKLNKTGSYFVINTGWTREELESYPHPDKRRADPRARSVQVVDNFEAAKANKCIYLPSKKSDNFTYRTESAPPQAQKRFESAPPIERPERLLRNHKYQKAGGRTQGAGVCKQTRAGKGITLEDLKNPRKLEKLYFEEAGKGTFQPSEAKALDFVAAAIRAGTLPKMEPDRKVKVFLGIIRKGLWSHITGDQEDRARAAISKIRDKNPAYLRAA